MQRFTATVWSAALRRRFELPLRIKSGRADSLKLVLRSNVGASKSARRGERTPKASDK
jgi:hypothetical protein